jgi:hypothetical protein
MSVLPFVKVPVRKVVLARNGTGDWFASYAGDPWEVAWRTEAGTLALVRDALTFDLTRGLPVVLETITTEQQGRAA